MTFFQIIAVILTFAAAGGYINHRWMRLPPTIGIMAFALIVSVAAIILGELGWLDLWNVSLFVSHIDFSAVLLHGMLSFLLFAGALHIRFDDLKSVRVPVAILATVGVILSTFITGSLVWLVAGFFRLNLPYVYALLFGALISPTDPIAVLAMLKRIGIPKSLYTKIGAESLFNDGVGIVIFLTLLSITSSVQPMTAGDVAGLLLREVLGGASLGLLLGWGTYRLLHTINDYKIEVLITLALVTGGYALGEALEVSAPICIVIAGLFIGNKARRAAMSEETRARVDLFWDLLDDILNAVLFMLIGLEIIVIAMTADTLILGVAAIAAALVGRFLSVGIPVAIMRLFMRFEHGTVRILTWGGLRGGLSIAMALSLPSVPEKNLIIPMTYIVALFSILVQGLTFQRVVNRLIKA